MESVILFPSVQEVAKEARGTVPLRYQLSDQDPPFICSTHPQLHVPIIDMLMLISEDSMDTELEKLHHACKDWGFFQLINRGVSGSLQDIVKKGIQRLFYLSLEEKKKLWQRHGDFEGFGHAFVLSEELKLEWADMFYMTSLPTHLRRPYLFSNLPLPFRDNLDAYSAELRNVAFKLLGFQAKALGIDDDDVRIFEGGWQAMRINYYPRCPQPKLVTGLNPHSNTIGITILLQINETEGLQIREDGDWIPIKPLPHAFMVNLGDTMEIMTNGIYRSIEHRVTVNSEKERLSIAIFYSPKLDGEMGLAPSLITPETPPNFKRTVVAYFFKRFLNRKLDRKSFIEVFRIQN